MPRDAITIGKPRAVPQGSITVLSFAGHLLVAVTRQRHGRPRIGEDNGEEDGKDSGTEPHQAHRATVANAHPAVKAAADGSSGVIGRHCARRARPTGEAGYFGRTLRQGWIETLSNSPAFA